MNFIEPFPKFRSEDEVFYNKRVTKPDIANIYHPAFTGLTFMAADQEGEVLVGINLMTVAGWGMV